MTSSLKKTRTCGDCQYYTPTLGIVGDCRRLAPVIVDSSTRWPQVTTTTLVCGEFKTNWQNNTNEEDLIDWNIFSTRVKSALRRSLIVSWEQLQQLETDELFAIPGIGATAVREISEVLNARRMNGSAQKHANEEIQQPESTT